MHPVNQIAAPARIQHAQEETTTIGVTVSIRTETVISPTVRQREKLKRQRRAALPFNRGVNLSLSNNKQVNHRLCRWTPKV